MTDHTTPTDPAVKHCPAHPAAEPFNATHRCPWCEIDRLRAELERTDDESAKLRRQIIDERVQATRTSQELFAKWRGERDQARAERDTLSSLLRGMARRVGQMRRELTEAEARGRAEALSKAADAWQRGAWANTPRHRDQVADRVGQAQYVTEWLRERAATSASSEGAHRTACNESERPTP